MHPEDALRPYFSAVRVHRREIDGQPWQTCYVYRDGGYLVTEERIATRFQP
jgi:hypothetical protein